jgi:hypothetical protein
VRGPLAVSWRRAPATCAAGACEFAFALNVTVPHAMAARVQFPTLTRPAVTGRFVALHTADGRCLWSETANDCAASAAVVASGADLGVDVSGGEHAFVARWRAEP